MEAISSLASSLHWQRPATVMLWSLHPTGWIRIARRRGKTLPKCQTLPPEVLFVLFETICQFENVNRAAWLAAICGVCRSWKSVAQSLLYVYLEPSSYRNALRLQRTLSHNATLAGYARHLNAPMFKGSFGTTPRRWRARPLCNIVAGTEFCTCLMSQHDYDSITKLFQDISDLCPNLYGITIPYYTSSTPNSIPSSFNHYFQLSQHQVSHIRSLTLSRPIFSNTNETRTRSPSQPMCFPALIELSVFDFSIGFIPSIMALVSLPALKTLKMHWGSCRLHDLQSFIASVNPTLSSIHFDGRVDTPLHGAQQNELPWYQDPSNPSDLLAPIKHLSIRVLRRDPPPVANLPPIINLTQPTNDVYAAISTHLPSLKHLDLTAFGRRLPFLELKSYLPRLESLQILCLYPYNIRSSMSMFIALSDLLRNKDHRMPALERISISWKMIRNMKQREMWKVVVFCLNATCEENGVELDVKLELIAPGTLPHFDPSNWRKPGIRSLTDRVLMRMGR